jgi:hypothetical protein
MGRRRQSLDHHGSRPVTSWRRLLCSAPLLIAAAACSVSVTGERAEEVERSRPVPRLAPFSMPRRPGFEENRGQWPTGVTHVARDGAAMLFLTRTEAVWRFRGTRDDVRMRWLGANPSPHVEGVAPYAARVNYFRGRDASAWRAGLPLYARVVYRDVYPGIDLVFHDERGTLEYDLVVAPGADPGVIRLQFDGPDGVRQGAAGELSLPVGGHEILHQRPIAYQDADGQRHDVAAAYAVRVLPGSPEHTEVAFALGAYDAARPLTIDPSVTYVTPVDPTIFTDNVVDSAVDNAGNLWLAGMTANAEFPVTDDAIDRVKSTVDDGYVVKLDPFGDVVYATYLGGSFYNCLAAVDVDADGNAFLAGTTNSNDYPVTGDALQPAYNDGQGDGFLTKLGPDGQILYSTYLGGAGSEQCSGRGDRSAGVASAADGSVYVLVSRSTSTALPLVPGAGRANVDADVFLVRFDPDMVAQWGRFIGSPVAGDQSTRVRTDAAGNAYVLGLTSRIFGQEHRFPTTAGAFMEDSESDQVHFLVKYATNGDVVYATFLGALTGQDSPGFGGDLDVDADGNAYVVWPTASTAAPVTAGAYQPMLAGFTDLFVAKVNTAGSALVYGTYLGGSSNEQPNLTSLPIAIDDTGQAYVGGFTFSTDLPLFDELDGVRTSNFVTKFNGDGTDVIYSTYVPQGVHTLAAADGGVYVAGRNVDGVGIGAARIEDEGAPCPGDCDGNGVVNVNEVVLGVGIALEQQPVTACAAFDTDGSGMVVISELITGVGSLLNSCG